MQSCACFGTARKHRVWIARWSTFSATPPGSVGFKPSQAINPIDRYIYATLAANGLAPAKPADRETLINRVTLDLGRSPAEKLPTDARLRTYQPGADPGLAALYFQYGRYLLLCSSRPGSQPVRCIYKYRPGHIIFSA